MARQPIHDRARALVAYELLFRETAGSTSATRKAAEATSRVLVNTFAEFGLERLIGHRLGFVNLTREFLTGSLPLPFAPGMAVLEVLETVEMDEQVVDGITGLADQGYAFALDDFVWGSGHEQLLDLASYVKLQVNGEDPDELAATVARCKQYPRLRLVAERLETTEDYEFARNLGFDLFQGYLLGRPETLSENALTPSRARHLQLLGVLAQPDVDLSTLASIITSDPALAMRILRATNSVSAAQHRRVSSIREAVVILGTERLRQWLAVMVVGDFVDSSRGGDPSLPMVRARWCQTLAAQAGLPPDVGFTIGLLSGVADLLGVESAELAVQLPLTDEVSGALIDERGVLGLLLAAVRAYENGQMTPPNGVGNPATPPPGVLARTYLEAVDWSVATAAMVGY